MKKFLCLALALMLIVSCFAACGGSGDDDKSTDTSSVSSGGDASTGDTSTSEGENEDYISMFKNIDVSAAYGLDGYDLGGREFYIMQRWFGYGKPTIDFRAKLFGTSLKMASSTASTQLRSVFLMKFRHFLTVQLPAKSALLQPVTSVTS